MSTAKHASKKMRAVKRAVRGKRMSEWCKRMSKWTSEWSTDPVLTSAFLVDPEHGGRETGAKKGKNKTEEGGENEKYRRLRKNL